MHWMKLNSQAHLTAHHLHIIPAAKHLMKLPQEPELFLGISLTWFYHTKWFQVSGERIKKLDHIVNDLGEHTAYFATV